MNHHQEAWEHVKKQLFGSVLEVTTKPNWGFKEDREDIQTMPILEYLDTRLRTDTILLHILSGIKNCLVGIE